VLKSVNSFIHKWRYSAEVAGPVVLLLLSALYFFSGALLPESLPEYFSSSSQLLGQVLLLILTPTFLITDPGIARQV